MTAVSWIPGLIPDGEITDVSPMARILSGATKRWLPAGFAEVIFVNRVMKFQTQEVTSNGEDFRFLISSYEPLMSLDEVKNAIPAGLEGLWARGDGICPTEICISIFPSIYSCADGKVRQPLEEEVSVGGHVVTGIGLLEDGVEIINFWPDWGRESLGEIPFSYLEQYMIEAWLPRFDPGPLPEALDQIFVRPNGEPIGEGETLPRWNAVFSHPQFKVLVSWGITSGSSEPLIESLAFLNVEGHGWLVVGWMQIRKVARTAVVQEFFVWPTYRERGIGIALAGHSILAAGMFGCWKIRWLIHRADRRAQTASIILLPQWLSSELATQKQTGDAFEQTDESSLWELVEKLADLGSEYGPVVKRVHTDEKVNVTVAHNSMSEMGLIVRLIAGPCELSTHDSCVMEAQSFLRTDVFGDDDEHRED